MKIYIHHLAFCLLSLLYSGSLFAQNRPNILIIVADDMGIDAMSAYQVGTDQPNTPHLDGLLQEGVLFKNAWSYPTCAPSRAALLTGRYGNKNGIVRSGPNMANSEITLFEHLRTLTNNAYSGAVFGKWHLGNASHPNNNGVDYYVGNLSSGVEDYFEWERTLNGVTDTSTDYVTTYTTTEAINWIQGQTQPWLVWMAYNAPHGPVHLPPDSLYSRTDTTTTFDKYLCMIESVDHEVGRLYASLSQDARDSTLLIFVGDNGTPNGQLQTYPRRHGKGTLYEGGIRVPMFVTGYGVQRQNEEETALVSFTDVFATITEILGTDLPGGMENSFSFQPLLSDPNAAGRTYNYSELGDPDIERAIRNQQYKLISRADGSQELYDLIDDPYETRDLVLEGLSPEQQVVLDDLQAEADQLFNSWSCRDDIQNGDEMDIDCGGSECAGCIPVSTKEIDPKTKAFYIHPNPAGEQLTLTTEYGTIQAVRVFNQSGQVRHFYSSGLHQQFSVDIGDLPEGLYYLEVTTDTGKSQQTFIKMNTQ